MKIAAYKGTNKNMQCRGYQYSFGKTHDVGEPDLCNSGAHACENPLDIFAYYPPNESRYFDVELDEVTEQYQGDSKRVGRRITFQKELSTREICAAHFEYVKNRTQYNEQGNNYSGLAARNNSSLAAQDKSSLAARNNSSLAALDWSSLAAQNRSSLAAQNRSSLAAQDNSSLAAQNGSSLAAQNSSSLAAQDESSLAAQNGSSLAAQNGSSLAAQDFSSLAAKDRSSLAAGENSVLAAFNSKAKANMGSIVVLAKREWVKGDYIITDYAAGIVDGKTLKPDTWYTVKDGKLVEVEDED